MLNNYPNINSLLELSSCNLGDEQAPSLKITPTHDGDIQTGWRVRIIEGNRILLDPQEGLRALHAEHATLDGALKILNELCKFELS